MSKSVSRRDVLRTSIFTAGAIAVSPVCAGESVGKAEAGKASGGNAATPSAERDPINQPIGSAQGMPGKEGRVVWQHDPRAVTWNGEGFWWQEGNIDQAIVDAMFAGGLTSLTDTATAALAWDALFKHFNGGKAGYAAGEKIAIKVNLNCAFTPDDNEPDATQQAVLALLRSLTGDAGVKGADITVYDATANPRFQRGKMPVRLISHCRAAGGEMLDVVFVDSYGENGAVKKEITGDLVTYSHTKQNGCGKMLPTCVKDAKYLINMPLVKGHVVCGVTLMAKNHYGTINIGKDHTWIDPLNTTPGPLPRYNPLVDILGSPEIGGKTLLYVFDALIASLHQHSTTGTWLQPPFNGHYTASLFFSLDPVAIDTVAYDLLTAAYNDPSQHSKDPAIAERLPLADKYMHEAALAHNAPSGIVYKRGAGRMPSLGVHEHGDFGAAQISDRYKSIQLVYNGPQPRVG